MDPEPLNPEFLGIPSNSGIGGTDSGTEGIDSGIGETDSGTGGTDSGIGGIDSGSGTNSAMFNIAE